MSKKIALFLILVSPTLLFARQHKRSWLGRTITSSTVTQTVATTTNQVSQAVPVQTTPITLTPSPTQVLPTVTDGLVTNEYAHWNPTSPSAVKNTIWDMTSGSLFMKNGKYWTGKIDDKRPDALSVAGTNSAVFRLNTKDFTNRNFTLSFDLTPLLMTSTPSTPEVSWDGVHVFLRYQSEFYLYYASVLRRDGLMIIKKKCPGGGSNGGTYYELSPAVKATTPTNIKVSVTDQSDGSVKIQILDDSKIVVTGIDNGIGCAVINNAGAVGLRGDNMEFYFNNFTVSKV